ncbi:unnamed protein product [Clonostachys chloroleuca]|uniref:Rrn9 domain-containing protein n=1 Tax=Clonostachys chloroleuca TaxID=1926264 RepID=A0AA35LWJ0_9HYPO|nr:unnamed protein product [Clonostachys chloroleuca]
MDSEQSTQTSATAWDLDKDEIASIASDELHQNRPNRWRGPKSTWRTLTEEERLLWQSIKRIEDQDLAIHLYNTFALKRRGKDPETAQDLIVQNVNGEESIWAPPKLWSAWPLKESQLPDEDLVATKDDPDEECTFRMEETKTPSSVLEEEIGALILRIAKDKFNKRMDKASAVYPSVEDEEAMATSSSQGSDEDVQESRAGSVGLEPGDGSSRRLIREEEDSDHVNDYVDLHERRSHKLKTPKTFKPAVSSNDELSYKLLTPAVRHILSQLDDTLRKLHRSRTVGLSYQSDSSTDYSSDGGNGGQSSRTRGRPRRTTTDSDPDKPQSPKLKTTKRGRPRKAQVPREGESQQEFQERIARESHRRLPPKAKDADDDIPQNSDAASNPPLPKDAADAAFEAWLAQGTTKTAYAMRKVSRWGLRDWSDVVGAASLAGFSPAVIARTTQRCSNLFGESMVVRHLHEVPASAGTGVQTVNYRPEPIQLADENDMELDSDDASDHLSTASRLQRRIASQASSLAPPSSASPASSPRRGRRRSVSTTSRANSSRSPSRSSVGLHLCPVISCDRAVVGFARRSNLKRHMEIVHGKQTQAAAPVSDVDSDDEVVGAIHVDGFLKPIAQGRGWRGGDIQKRQRKKFHGEKRVKESNPRGNASRDSE